MNSIVLLKSMITNTSNTLVSRVRNLVGHDDQYARDAIREVAKWLEEDGSHCGARCAFRLEQQTYKHDEDF